MSLIYCPECKESISSDAHTCPHCGLPFEQEDLKVVHTVTRYSANGWGTFIYFLIAIAGLVMLLEGRFFGLLLMVIGVALMVANLMLWGKAGKKLD